MRIRPCERDRRAARWRCRAGASLILGLVGVLGLLATAQAEQRLPVRLSWGHESTTARSFHVRLLTEDANVTALKPVSFEPGDTIEAGVCVSRAGAGDVDGVDFVLEFPDRPVHEIENLHSIWNYWFSHADADTARRLRLDAAFRLDSRKLTVQMDREGTAGFSVTVDQLLTNQTFWLPELDVFLSAGDAPVSFADHQKELAAWSGRRILTQLEREPEASYEQYTSRWEDMGSPVYRNPASVPPGHIVCLTWDSAIPKFGIDRGANVWNDLGNPDHFRLDFDFGDLSRGMVVSSGGGRSLSPRFVHGLTMNRELGRALGARPVPGLDPSARRGLRAPPSAREPGQRFSLEGEWRSNLSVRGTPPREPQGRARTPCAPWLGGRPFGAQRTARPTLSTGFMGTTHPESLAVASLHEPPTDAADARSSSTNTSWLGQSLADGLPIITTTIERDGVRFEVEQFAFPLHGPPTERRGDLAMVLMQKVRVTELRGQARTVPVAMTQRRELTSTNAAVSVNAQGGAFVWQESVGERTLLAVQGDGVTLPTNSVEGGRWFTNRFVLAVPLSGHGTREVVVKLPSPPLPSTDRAALLGLNHDSARAATRKFWSDYLARGARFIVPEEAVNTLFRANLWHALRLPRRHGGAGPDVRIDLPYSNFAYDQNGAPWPVNQAVYVDYMLYDLRGYHDLSAEELAAMYRKNQEANGHVGGFANWGVYTPGMIYAAAEHYLLTGDRAAFESLLPQTLRALDWCRAEIDRAAGSPAFARGLVLAPLNDLSHDTRAWAFNQAYLFAGADRLARALTDLQHPRAAECRAIAQSMFAAIQRGFAHASLESPIVQMRDHTWMPYVPGDALTPRRILDLWYPTDVDTGALHLSRLKALDLDGPLTTYLLNDHEDNLFLNGWGMANEPVYNQHATALLLRDDVKPAIRTFYSMMACAFSHSVFEPVEHRWAWGQYFGPPSTDGAWFDLYRHMLIRERDDDSLLLLQATPRRWLEDHRSIRVERAPTYFGPLSLTLESRAATGEIAVTLEMPSRKPSTALFLRLRHPTQRPLRSVSVDGKNWTDFDTAKEWVRIPNPQPGNHLIVARY